MSLLCVVGAGPAGCVFSARMAQLGHEVVLIERLAFPRPRLGESLSPGVLPLLEMIGARQAVEGADFPRVHRVTTTWDGELGERQDPLGRGLLVDRGRFDSLLLERARAFGVQVLQPASILSRRHADGRWQIAVEHGGSRSTIAADFLVDAAGRQGLLRGRRSRQAVQTVAIHGYWRAASLPTQPRIETDTDAWLWGVPIPGGLYNTLVFLDAATLRQVRGRPLTTILQDYVGRSGLLSECRDAVLEAPARAIDATPYVDEQSVTASTLTVGDAALAIDPLSSSGVQKAIQSALSGAIVANTLLRRPGSAAAAMRFYQATIDQAAARHRGWAAAQYGRVAARGAGPFWDRRAVGAADEPPERGPSALAGAFEAEVALSPSVEFVELPCIDGDFVTVMRAVRHPILEEPVAFVGRWEIAPLLHGVRAGMTPLDIARSWSDRVPLRSALAIAGWLLDHQILVPAPSDAPVAARA